MVLDVRNDECWFDVLLGVLGGGIRPPTSPPDGDRNTCRLLWLLPRLDWLMENRSRSVRDVLRATATAADWI